MTHDEYINKACAKCKRPTMEVRGNCKVCTHCGFQVTITKTLKKGKR